MTTKATLQAFVDSLSSVHVRKIFGDPVTAEGRTIIPVAKIGYGFGAGGGSNCAPGNGVHRELTASDENVHEHGEGSGGGGGLFVKPLGVIEVSQAGTRYLPINNTRKLLGAAALGLLVGVLVRRRKK